MNFSTLDPEKSLRRKTVSWAKADLVGKYILPFMITLFSSFPILVLIDHFKTDGKIWIKDDWIIITISVLALSLVIRTVLVTNKSEKLIVVPINKSVEEVRKELEEFLFNKKWGTMRSNKKYLLAYSYKKNVLGAQLVVLYDKQTIYINVQNQYGFRGYFPFSFGRNKKIRETLIKEISSHSV